MGFFDFENMIKLLNQLVTVGIVHAHVSDVAHVYFVFLYKKKSKEQLN